MAEPVTFLGGRIKLFFGDYAAFQQEPPDTAVLITDPPYGIGYRVNGRGGRLLEHSTKEREAFAGGDKPIDVAPLLRFPRAAIFGANYLALPPGGKWIVWDKRRDSKPDDHSDCELIWTTVPGADRIHRQKWRGVVREGEENISRSRKLHPNQKPVALIGAIFDHLAVSNKDIVFDPYMGSGSTGVVALRRGAAFVGIERDPEHFKTAVARIGQEAHAFATPDTGEGR